MFSRACDSLHAFSCLSLVTCFTALAARYKYSRQFLLLIFIGVIGHICRCSDWLTSNVIVLKLSLDLNFTKILILRRLNCYNKNFDDYLKESNAAFLNHGCFLYSFDIYEKNQHEFFLSKQQTVRGFFPLHF